MSVIEECVTREHGADANSELVPTFGFQADGMSPEDNAAAWRDAIVTLFDVDELARGELGPFRAELASYALGTALIGVCRASAQRFRRTLDTVARSGVDHILVQHYTRGGFEGVAGTRPVQVRAGDVCVFDLAQTLETRATAFENLTLVVPRPKWMARLARPEILHGVVIPGDNIMGALIGRHLQVLAELAPSMTLSDCESVVDGSVDLIAACLRAELDRLDAGPDENVDVLIRIKQHIEARLGDGELSGETIAAQFGLSRASLYRLFTPYGGVARYLRSRRLHQAFFDLATPSARAVDVAERWHLGTEENFARAFKAAYGITPRMARTVSMTTIDGGCSSEGATSQISRWMRNTAPPLR